MSARITDWHAMEGKTIRRVEYSPCGKYGCLVNAVIVFEDDTWAALCAEPDGYENATLSLYGGAPYFSGIADILHPEELYSARMVTDAQRDYLLGQMADAERAQKAKRLAELQAEAAKLQEEIGE